MKLRFINIALLLSFLICYLEWGGNNSGFVSQLEYQLFAQGSNLHRSILHPFILLPLTGQLLLLYNTLAPKPRRVLTIPALLLLSLLVLMVLLTGILSGNWKMIVSTIPYLVVSVYFFVRKRRNNIRH
jgi:hypothetical protein